jgi:hypothetical protein
MLDMLTTARLILSSAKRLHSKNMKTEEVQMDWNLHATIAQD